MITTSGVLVTVLFGLSSVITSSKAFKVPTKVHLPLGLALVGFLLATACALGSNWVMKYFAINLSGLQANVSGRWSASYSAAGRGGGAGSLRGNCSDTRSEQYKSEIS